jgi:hypothetical protein
MTEERRQRILRVAQDLEDAGFAATNSAVYSVVMGHRGHVVAVLKARRAARAGEGGVAVAEEEEEDAPVTAQEMAEDLQQLEASYESWHLSLEKLWEIEHEGPLSESNFGRKQWLEYQMVQNLQAQEQLRTALDRARLVEAVRAGQAQHDAGIAATQGLAEETVQALAHLASCLTALQQQVEHQMDGLTPIRSRDGHAQFDLPTGRQEVEHLLSLVYPSDFRVRDMLHLLIDTPLTVGRAREALRASPRFQPFPERAITNYLTSITEGTLNGSDS